MSGTIRIVRPSNPARIKGGALIHQVKTCLRPHNGKVGVMHESSARPSGGNGKAIVLGFLAMILGAALWAVITVVTAHEFSLVAIGVGALVGLTVFAARPSSTGIAVVAALFTVVGCALGEFLAIPAYVAHKAGASFSKVLSLEVHQPKLYFDSLDGKTYLFWAIGAVAAFSMVFRRIQAARASAPAPAPYGAAPQQPYAPQQPSAPAYPNPQQQYGPGPQQYGGQPGPGQQQYPPR
ncbi:hypothetical protein Airi01_100200 [Actinoallomurus iriomotensis]|uniref:Uncharacterized protein n=2 Tax=Actinoallomurus iriomotensis TaxID=478107 RepID=A0A9W6RU38_9ACTN|nr:hypothetical protein Airi01_100200 [Actinoallomurus iriomotensis]